MPFKISLLAFFLALACVQPAAHAGVEAGDAPLRDLTEYKSVNGVLTATLEAAERPVHLGPITMNGEVYNGDYAGPVLRAHPGDIMRVTLVNHLAEETNLHFHGMHSSPLGNGDNMHIAVQPGQSFGYEIDIPQNQPPGLYWFHAHIHGKAERQISAGLSGTVVIEGLKKQVPQLAGLQEKIFVLKDYQFGDSDDPFAKALHKIVRTVNGQLRSGLTMRPGETQLWRFTNQSANLINTISLKGHKLRVIATDGVLANRETSVDSIDILPAGRIEALVDAGEPGTYDLVSEHTMTGTGEYLDTERVLGHLTVEGEPVAALAPLAAFPAKTDLRTRKIDERRSFTFTQLNDDKTFLLNGRKYDHARMDTRVPLGNVEEWTVRNDTDDMHVFHIHQIHFQVAEINGKTQPFEGLVDDVRIPERGEVKLILPFTEPQIVGSFMYHCHVLKHEDGGMMANIEVYDPHRTDVAPAAHTHPD